MAPIGNFGSISSKSHSTCSMSVCSITWVIKDFQKLSRQAVEFYESPYFFVDANKKHKFSLNMYFERRDGDSEEYVSISVYLSVWDYENTNDKFVVQFAVIDKDGGKQCLQAKCVSAVELGLVRHFVQKAYLSYKAAELLPNDELRIACRILNLSSMAKQSDGDADEVPHAHQCVQLEGFEKLLNNEKLSDFKLDVKGKEFKVHRAILAARSPMFEAMFNSDMRETSERKAQIVDVEPEIMEKLLLFVYTGKIDAADLHGKMLAAADKYQFDSLKLLCENELVRKLSVDNIYDTLLLADQNNATSLKTRAVKFFDDNLKTLAAAKNFAALIDSLPVSVKNEFIRVIALKR